MQVLIITYPCWSNHLARGSFWVALWIHTRWGRHSGSFGFGIVTQPPPLFTKGYTFCFSGMLQPKLKQAPRKLLLYSLRFESGAWPCSSLAACFPIAALLRLRHPTGSWAFHLPLPLHSSLGSLRGCKSLCLCSFVSSFALLICTRFPFVCWSIFCSLPKACLLSWCHQL